MRKLFIALGLLYCAIYASAQVYPSKEEGWAKVPAEKHGFSTEALSNAKKYMIEHTHCTGMIVVCSGECIFEWGKTRDLSYIASCRKSVLAMLYGKYVENGTIDLNTSIGQLGMDDLGGLLPSEKEATIYDLITCRSGVYHPASNPGDDAEFTPARGSKKHGEYFLYNNWDFNAAGGAFEKLTGKSVYQALNDDIAVNIGMQDWSLEAQRYGGNTKYSVYPAYHIYLSTRDMARLGYLMLRKGNWNGEQIISESWVKYITSVHTPMADMNPEKRRDRYNYGCMWWLFDEKSNSWHYKDGYIARGAGGQFIVVLPALDMVVAFKTDMAYERKTLTNNFYKVLDIVVNAQKESN